MTAAVPLATLVERLAGAVGAEHVQTGDDVPEDLTHDESLGTTPVVPRAAVHPASTDEVAAVVRIAAELAVPVTARGSGTGLSGGCIPHPDGIVVAFDRMADIVEIDTANAVAVVQPGVTLAQLNEVLGPMGLVYPVFPGENSASLGGNVNTNAGGMRAVKYGVTRHHVLGLEAVLGTGEVIRTGGKLVKTSSGYDLTQLLIGSEGTLAIVCEAIVKLHPRPDHSATLLAPFPTFDEVAAITPTLVNSTLHPMIVEYIDLIAMAGIRRNSGIELGIPDDVEQTAQAYLVVVLEDHHPDRLDEDVEAAATMLADAGALDVYVLPAGAGARLVEAREKVFWTAKASGADEIVDVVVPRAALGPFLDALVAISRDTGSFMPGCGHVGDGNVHFSLFQPDEAKRAETLQRVFRTAHDLGGMISGEHGLGVAKRTHHLALADPQVVALERRIKAAFDPAGILNPDVAR